MSGLPRGPVCPEHPGIPATIVCAVCGTFACPECVTGGTVDEPVCRACQVRARLRVQARPPAPLDLSRVVSESWSGFRLQWPTLVGVALLSLGCQVALGFAALVLELSERLLPKLPYHLFYVGLQLITYYVGTSLQLGAYIVWFRVRRAQEARVDHLFRGFRYGLRGLAATILYMLALTPALGAFALVGLRVAGGIPGIPLTGGGADGLLVLLLGLSLAICIPLAVGFSLWWTVMVDSGLGAVASLGASWRLTHGQRLRLTALLLLTVVTIVAGVLACGVGLLVAYPLAFGFTVAAYSQLAWPGNHYFDRG